jgi:hypothetical protein
VQHDDQRRRVLGELQLRGALVELGAVSPIQPDSRGIRRLPVCPPLVSITDTIRRRRRILVIAALDLRDQIVSRWIGTHLTHLSHTHGQVFGGARRFGPDGGIAGRWYVLRRSGPGIRWDVRSPDRTLCRFGRWHERGNLQLFVVDRRQGAPRPPVGDPV